MKTFYKDCEDCGETYILKLSNAIMNFTKCTYCFGDIGEMDYSKRKEIIDSFEDFINENVDENID